jgi:hypothetical protein
VYEGGHLDPDSVVPLTADEEAEYRKVVAVAKDVLAVDMKVERDRLLNEHAQIAVAKGIDPNSALTAALQCLDKGLLLPSEMVVLGGKPVSVFELLTNGEPYDKKSGLDPIEPDYNGGASVSIFYWNNGGFPIISSFAHGQKTYSLRHDEGSVRTVIKTKNQSDIIRALVLSDVDELTYEVLVGETAKALGLGNKRVVITDAVAKKTG